jgi:hypothetical protein
VAINFFEIFPQKRLPAGDKKIQTAGIRNLVYYGNPLSSIKLLFAISPDACLVSDIAVGASQVTPVGQLNAPG